MSTKFYGAAPLPAAAQTGIANGLVAIVLAIILPPLGIFFAKDALAAAKTAGTDDTIARFALWISVALTIMGGIVVIVGFITSVVIPVLSMR